jgi:NADPH:quinone reductase
MRAWQVQEHGEPRQAFRRVEVEPPVPRSGELRVRVQAAAVGMPDVFMCRGTYPLTPPLPFVCGQEVCGVVDAVGDGVEVPVGSRVMGVTTFFDGRGGFAEESILTPSTAFRVPDEMTATVAAAFRIAYSTAWTALVERGGLQRGENLVVLGGAGGSGTAAIQLGRALGATVLAVAAGPDKTEFCRRSGADVVIDRARSPVRDAIITATKGRGADVVFDPVGGDVASDTLRALADFGRFLVVGFASGKWVRVNGGELTMSSRSVMGVIASSGTPEQQVHAHESLLDLVARGDLDPVVRAVPFEDLPASVEAVAHGTAMGKLVIRVD